MSPATFTTTEIARKLARTARGVRKVLAGIPPSGPKEVNGQTVNAWALADLPTALCFALEKAARANHYRDAEAYLFAACPAQAAPLAREKRLREVHLDHLHRPLGEKLRALENRTAPTLEDRPYVWQMAFEHFEGLCADCPERHDRRQIKRSLLRYLKQAMPGLAKTNNALRAAFDGNLRVWRETGRTPSALNDERPLRSGRPSKGPCADCLARFVGAVVELDGNESQAYRRLRFPEERLCAQCAATWPFDVREAKSDVPRAWRQAARPAVQSALPYRRGPEFARLAGPYIPRDWSDTGPGDYFSADDVTWNHYYWFTDDAGQIQIARGECLLMTDLRTGYPLGFLMIAGKYNSLHVRSLVLRVHDLETVVQGETVNTGGLPHVGLFLEKGVWAARLIEGPHRRGWQWNPWRESELGLRERGLNLDVRHATTPRSKPIEGLLRILQERMRCEPGFVGFDERRDEREVMQDFLARVRSGKEHAGNELPSMDRWRGRVAEILQEFADEPQNGKMLPGVSPAEAWWNGLGDKPGIADKPLRRLAEESRYLLASHKRPVEVTPQGIRLRIGKREWVFWGETLAPYVNRRVLAFFNLECPELLVCSDLERQHYFTVKAVTAPAMTASAECLAALNHQRASFTKAAKVLFGGLPKPLGATITRDTEHDETTRALGAFVNEATAQHREQQQAQARKLQEVHRLAGTLGAIIPATPRNPDRVKQGLDLEAEALAEIRALEDNP